MVPPRGSLVVLTLLVSAVVIGGCAKRPAMTQASAPAPTGASGTVTGATATLSSATPVQPTTQTVVTPSTPTPASPTAAAPTRVTDFAAEANLKDVFFDFDKYDVRPGDAKTLDANASWLKSNPNHLVLIEGHCDERGTNEYNLALGERRAKSAMNYLVSQGVQASRITIISYGEERPACAQRTDACWAKNRRAHFLVKQR